MLKKSTLVVIALCLIIGGIGIGATGMALGGKTALVYNQTGWDSEWNFLDFTREYGEDNNHYIQEKVEALESFNKIDVKSGTVAIMIKEGESYSLSIDVGSEVELKYGIQGDTLYVEQKGRHIKSNILGNHDWNKYGGEIVITVPQGEKLDKTSVALGVGEGKFENLYTEKFELIVGVADAHIQGMTAEALSIEGGVGRIVLEEGRLGNGDIEMGVGSIKVATELSGDLDVQGGIGDLEIILNGEERDYNYMISRGGGSIAINDERYNGVGDVNIRNKSDQTIDIEAGLGSINIETR